MDNIQPWMRLKVKADTFFLPDVDGAVYFRNNAASFRMHGTSVLAWIEKLLPAFDGSNTLESLTEGLPTPYRDRIYEIAGVLYDNGFLRDVSTDENHQLTDGVMERFSAQIAFVDNIIGSGAARFQTYRNANVLAIGAGSMLVSLVRALFESGLATVNVVIMDKSATNRSRLNDFVLLYDCDDDHVTLNDLSFQASDLASVQAAAVAMDAVPVCISYWRHRCTLPL